MVFNALDLESLANTLYDKHLMNALRNHAGWKSTSWASNIDMDKFNPNMDK